MSFEAQAWARTVRTGSPTKKAVLMDIANYASNHDACAWPSQQRIAYNTELSERAVRSALAELEEAGLIRREKRRDTTDRIFLLMPDPDNGAFRRPASNDNEHRHHVPVVSGAAEGAAGRNRHDIPVDAAGDAGGQRHDVPEAAAPDAGGYRQELPPNLSVEPSLNPSDEPTRKREKKRGPAAPFPADAFDRFWKIYPAKIGKGDARKSFAKIASDGNVELDALMAGLNRYVNKKDDRPWCNPSTFLNQERWDDEAPVTDKHAALKAKRSHAI